MLQDAKSLSYKLLLSLILISVCFVAAWLITKQNYASIRASVNAIAQPNEANLLSNKLFKDIVIVDQLEKQSFDKPLIEPVKQLLETKKNDIQAVLDTLKKIHINNSTYLEKIQKVDTLLNIRAAKIKAFILLQQDFRKSDSLQFQLNQLSSFVQSAYLRSDDQIFKQENKISATTYTDTLIHSEDNKPTKDNFWNKLFGKKKEPVVKEIQHFILEQLNVSLDTLQLMHDDSVYQRLAQKIEQQQQTRNVQLKKMSAQKEALFQSTNTLFAELLSHIESIEGFDNANVENINTAASLKIDQALSDMTKLLWGFGFIVFVLGILIVFDLNRNRQYKIALQQASQQAATEAEAKQAFLSNMSHEMRSPLQSIIGYTELLKSEKNNANNTKIAVIEQASNHLLEVVNHFLDYNAFHHSNVLLQSAAFEVKSVFDNVYNLMLVQAEKKGIAFKYNISKDLIGKSAKGDSFRLKQVVLNLLHNAIKYTNEGEVTLDVSAKYHQSSMLLNIKVIDTGVGIPHDKLETIFLPYHQASFSDARKGTGLGLSIVKEIVDAFKGDISVNANTAKGTTFTVKIPLEMVLHDANEKSNPNLLGTNESIKHAGKIVWVIDDDPVLLTYYKLVFEEWQINYNIFQNGQSLLDTPVPDNLALVLMDIRMPDYLGYDLIHLAKEKINSLQKVTFIAVTGQVLSHEINKAVDSGFTEVLNKPFNKQQLIGMLSKYLDNNATSVSINSPESIDEELINLFKATMKDDLQLIQDACLKADLASLHLLMHTHAGRLAQFKFDKLAQSAREIESNLQLGKLPLQTIYSYMNNVEEQLL